MPVHGLFPTPVGFYELDVLTEEQRDWIVGQPLISNMGNRVSADKHLLDADIMGPVRSQIETAISEFCTEALSAAPDFKLKITQSWCNYTTTGESHHKHHHPNSLVSGVYYPQTAPGDSINFFNGSLYADSFDVSPTGYNQFNSDEWNVPTPQDSLILFPSTLRHEVSPRQSTGLDRISLSFNTFFAGDFGADERMTRVRFS